MRHCLFALLLGAVTSVGATDLSTLRAEQELGQWLIQARSQAPTPELRARVQALTRYSAKALKPSPEPHHDDVMVPAVDVASLARGTLRAWQVDEHLAAAKASLSAGAPLALDDPEAIALLVQGASPAQLQALKNQALPTQASAILARRLGDPEIYGALFARPADAFVVAALADVVDALPPGSAMQVLGKAARQPALASAATLAMASLQPSVAELTACLADPVRGGSCAQLLAARDDPSTFDALSQLAERGRDDAASRRALLALWWNGAPRATGFLRAYAANPAMPSTLREQVSGWLR